MKTIIISTILIVFGCFLLAQTAPIVNNVSVFQRTDGSKIIDIYYDVLDVDEDTLCVILQLSSDDGSTFDIIPTDSLLSGDIGGEILSGTGKHIIWQAGEETYTFEGNTYKYKVIANDPYDTVTDIDGNIYQTVQIGDQIWMAENLKVTHYRNGDPIPNVSDYSEWEGLTVGAYCYYSNNSTFAETYGNMYNWYAASDTRNIAPEGWHVPSDDEIKQLEMYLGMSEFEVDEIGWERGTNEGSKLAGRADLWESGTLTNDPEFDTSGFNFLPSGIRYYNGGFNYLNNFAHLWSSTESGSSIAVCRDFYYVYSTIYRDPNASKNYGFSIRCVKD